MVCGLSPSKVMFTEDDWQRWEQREEVNYILRKNRAGSFSRVYRKKGYLHFDIPFWFPDQKSEIKKIISNNLKVYNKNRKSEEWFAFKPFLRVMVKTPRFRFDPETQEFTFSKKIRPICYAAHVDSLVLGYYAFVLGRKYEDYVKKNGTSDAILAYRQDFGGKCNIQFSKEIFDYIRFRGECTAIALDIKGYFDHINHKILKEKWIRVVGERLLPPDQYRIFKNITNYSYVNKNSLLKRYKVTLSKIKKPRTLLEIVPGKSDYDKFDNLRKDRLIVSGAVNRNDDPFGIPQGSPISSLMSNIYLIDFDEVLVHRSRTEGFLYRRYCDDIILVCDSRMAEKLQSDVITLITKYKLEIQPSKVERTEFKFNSIGQLRAYNHKKIANNKSEIYSEKYYKSLQYLGFEFNGQNIFIRSSSLSRYYRKLKSRIAKTVAMAYSEKSTSEKIWREQLFHRYTHLGKRNFLKYAFNASKSEYKNAVGETKEGMNSPTIKKQLRRHFTIMMNSLVSKNASRYVYKAKLGKVVLPKRHKK